MTDERYTFEAARVRLEEIATLARKKDTSLEKSLDLLEEGVRLANICTDLVDHTDLSATVVVEIPDGAPTAAVDSDDQSVLADSVNTVSDQPVDLETDIGED
jgi:exodeoxyribonuclease VII small subunit